MSLEDMLRRFRKGAKRGFEVAVIAAGMVCMGEKCDFRLHPNPIAVTAFADQRGDDEEEVFIPDVSSHFTNNYPEPGPLAYSVLDFDTAEAPVFLEGDTIHIYASPWHGVQVGRVQACDEEHPYICNSAYLTVNFNGPIIEQLFADTRVLPNQVAQIPDVLSHFSGDTVYNPLEVSVLDFNTADTPISLNGDTISIGPSYWHGISYGNVMVCDSDTDSDPATTNVCITTPLKVIFNYAPVLDMVVDPSSELEPLSGEVYCTDLDDDARLYGLMSSTLPEATIVYGGTDGLIYSCLDGNTSCTSATPDPLPRGSAGSREIDACCSDGLETVCYSDTPHGKAKSGGMPLVFDVNDAPNIDSVTMTKSAEGDYLQGTVDVTDSDTVECGYSSNGGLSQLVVNSDCTITSTVPMPFNSSGSYNVLFWARDIHNAAVTKYEMITVANTNRAPVITGVTIDQAEEGKILLGGIHGSDPDGDPVNCYLVSSDLPEAKVDPLCTIYSDVPLPSLLSGTTVNYNVVVRMTDGLLDGTTSEDFEVQRPPTKPYATCDGYPCGPSFGIGEDPFFPLEFKLNSTDPNGDPITYQSGSSPIGAPPVDPNTGIFSWSPTCGQGGITYTIGFQAKDDKNHVSTAYFVDIIVTDDCLP